MQVQVQYEYCTSLITALHYGIVLDYLLYISADQKTKTPAISAHQHNQDVYA